MYTHTYHIAICLCIPIMLERNSNKARTRLGNKWGIFCLKMIWYVWDSCKIHSSWVALQAEGLLRLCSKHLRRSDPFFASQKMSKVIGPPQWLIAINTELVWYKKNAPIKKKCKKSWDPFPSPTLLPVWKRLWPRELFSLPQHCHRHHRRQNRHQCHHQHHHHRPSVAVAFPQVGLEEWHVASSNCLVESCWYVFFQLSKRRWVTLRTAGSSSSSHKAFHPCRLKACLIAARYEYQNMSTWRRVLQWIETAENPWQVCFAGHKLYS